MELGKVQENKGENCQKEGRLEYVNLQAQNKEYNDYMELVKTLDITEFAPPGWLGHTETPFKWCQCLKPDLLFKANLDSKLEDYSYDNSCYTLEKCSLLLTLVFEKIILKDNAKSRTYLNQLEEELSNVSCDESNAMYTRIGPALKHVYSATNAYLMSLTSDLQLEETAKKIGRSLEPFSQMSPQIQAGIEALKGKFYLWCCTDSDYAYKHILKASKLDPDFAPWQYWTAKILRKKRREMKEKEPKNEIFYLESAVEKQRDPKHLIYLAQAYREKANFLYKTKSNDFEFFKSDTSKEIDTLNQKSLDLYTECWSKSQNCPALLRRLGNGLMNLPRYQADYNLAKEVLHRAEELSKHAVTYHILGTYYFRFEQDEDRAREYYQKAADHGLNYGYNELIRLSYLNDPNYDPYEDLKKQEEAMQYSCNMDSVICDLGWYYLFFKNDLPKALEYFWKIIEKDEESVLLTSYKSESLLVHPPINLYSLLVNETLLLLNMSQQHGYENIHILKDFINKVKCVHPELLKMMTNSSLMSFVRNRTDKFITNTRRKKIAPKPEKENKKL